MPLRGSSSDEANWNAEGMARVREWEEARARWRSWRLQTEGRSLTWVQTGDAILVRQIDYRRLLLKLVIVLIFSFVNHSTSQSHSITRYKIISMHSAVMLKITQCHKGAGHLWILSSKWPIEISHFCPIYLSFGERLGKGLLATVSFSVHTSYQIHQNNEPNTYLRHCCHICLLEISLAYYL